MSELCFVGGSLPLSSSLLAYGCGVLRYPLLLQGGAFKCIDHGIEFIREFRDFGGGKCINHERHERHEIGMGVQ